MSIAEMLAFWIWMNQTFRKDFLVLDELELPDFCKGTPASWEHQLLNLDDFRRGTLTTWILAKMTL
ncbi:hypothetical protein RhiirA4_489827 [Rhizophagus irregularis]|uniref:Uncharacterized protein n=1 Tax=Rhizophagus irregularis TaxID=588596 RepID=A0A2I1HV52_9GLOM|nr:hypothetical protein RhiirA4_470896 [Rhizophagus irregularis]PKY62761.1 hypothetical protein RhiirA4_489827 [Rhizophagus irregularis]